MRPPFSPDSTVRDFTAILKQYRCSSVTGDRYAGEWVRERFRLEGIGYEVSEKTASDYYNEALPLFMARRVELVEHTRLQLQLAHLERRVARQGRLTVSHRLAAMTMWRMRPAWRWLLLPASPTRSASGSWPAVVIR